MSDVFISYARATEPAAELVESSLAALGYSVWRDRALPIHRPYSQEIESNLKGAKAVVVLWSKDAANSDWVRAEADVAREAKKLVQVSVDATLPPMPFNQIQCGDLSDWSGDVGAPGWRKLLEGVASLVSYAAPAEAGRHSRPSLAPVLAVLPFDNLSGDQDLVYFSDGVSEEILQTVAKTVGLKVIGRSSSFQVRGRDKSARHVAGELGCTHLLDGSVRRSGERVRITAQLIECAGQTTLWSDRFDRSLSDVFALQDEIASAVAEALKLAFAPKDVSPRIDPLAFDLYLRAKTQLPGRLGTYNAGLLQAATSIAPNFAQAWQALAITHAVDALFAVEGNDVEALRLSAEKAAHRALELDPAAGQALVALSLIEPICGRLVEREALLERALAAAPNDAVVLFHLSRAAYGVGRISDGLDYIRQAHEIDRWAQGENWFGVMLSAAGQGEHSEAVWREALEEWPTYEILIVNGIIGRAARRDWAGVAALREHAARHGIDTVLTRDAFETADVVQHGPAERLLEPFRRQLAATGAMSLRVGFACELGFTEEIYQLLEQASFSRLFEPSSHWTGNDFGLHVLFQSRKLRQDRRFVRLCARLGLCQYWLTTERWPDCVDRVPYDFRAEARASTVTNEH